MVGLHSQHTSCVALLLARETGAAWVFEREMLAKLTLLKIYMRAWHKVAARRRQRDAELLGWLWLAE